MSIDLHPDVVDAFCAEAQSQLWLHVANLSTTFETWPTGTKVNPFPSDTISPSVAL